MSADNSKDECNRSLAELAVMREQRQRDELPSIMTRRSRTTEIVKLQCDLEAAITECNVLKAQITDLQLANDQLNTACKQQQDRAQRLLCDKEFLQSEIAALEAAKLAA